MTAKQFISRLAKLRLSPLPGNIRSRRFQFNRSVAARIETFEMNEVWALLAACDGFSAHARSAAHAQLRHVPERHRRAQG